jgi:hypothetical protein
MAAGMDFVDGSPARIFLAPRALTSQPAQMSIVTQAALPLQAAIMNGVVPSSLRTTARTVPASIKFEREVESSEAHAWNSPRDSSYVCTRLCVNFSFSLFWGDL